MNFNHKAEIMSMYVRVEALGMRIGKALMKKIIEIAEGINRLEQVNLTVMNEKILAKNLYESLRFHEVEDIMMICT